jgi:C4-dicarboxylate-specific signal transduction histidine kinase
MNNDSEDPSDFEQLNSLYKSHPEQDKLVLSVIDNGVGISNEDKANLFKLFGCLKSTKKMNAKGVGLGLVISKMITEEFGGEVRLYSTTEIGTVFQSSFLLRKPLEDVKDKPIEF